MKTITDLNLEGKRVLIRADFNVPLDDEGNITDTEKLERTLPTIRYALDKAKQVVLMSHLGRPKGEVVQKLKMDGVARKLSELLGEEVAKVDDCVDVELPEKRVVLLENLRFHKEEKENDEAFAKKLTSHGDVYVNDAFGTAHRAHASVEAVTRFLPSAAGFLLAKEVQFLSKATDNPAHPYITILGGSKISTKLEIIESLIKRSDKLLLGGAMIFTFYKSQGHEIGKSLVEDEFMGKARELLGKYPDKLVLPTDVVVASEFKEDAVHKVVTIDKMPADWIGLDIGPQTIAAYKEILKGAALVVWNGPMGVFEMPAFAKGTAEIGRALAEIDGITIVGGGDSAAAVNKLGLRDGIDHVSTGGGASMEFLEGKPMPALAALEEGKP